MLEASVFWDESGKTTSGKKTKNKKQHTHTHTHTHHHYPACCHWTARQLRNGLTCVASLMHPRQHSPDLQTSLPFTNTEGYARQKSARPHLCLAVKWRDRAKGN